ncbi:MAG: glycosyltransferase family 1 protein [Vicinamibacterales bacterium]
MRVGVDGRAFTSPAAGVRRYISALVGALLALGDGIEIVALGGGGTGLPAGVAHVPEPAHPPSNPGWILVGLPRAAARGRVSLIHAPAYTAPFWAGVPVVLTIHDVSYARRPEWYPHRVGPARQWYYRRSAHSAAHVLTDSEFSAAEIVAAYSIPRDRLTVVPLGVDADAFAPPGPDLRHTPPAGVPTPYLLHVGDLHERRNLAPIVEALLLARRRGDTPPGLSLVLAGLDRGVGAQLTSMVTEAGAADVVVLLGPVSDSRLKALYRGATALVYPSLYEGFGLPLLEAMASGTPVIASRAASIPEVVGDAAIVLDPDDVRGWSDAIVSVATDPVRHAALRAAGLRHAAGFTWERTARLTRDVYRRVLARQSLAGGGAGQ